MEHNLLTGIASARPVIYTDGVFISCYLDHGKFIPEAGLNQLDLLSILNGEFVKAGSDLVEEFTLKCKLRTLDKVNEDTFELDQFPLEELSPVPTSSITIESNTEDDRRDSRPFVQISTKQMTRPAALDGTRKEVEIRKTFERQVTWIMSEGEDYVTMESFSRFTDALVLLDVLKEHNVPSVVSFLARRGEPVAITFSKINIGLDCLMFCLFQA